MKKKKNPVIKYRHPGLRARSFEADHLTFEGRYGFGLGQIFFPKPLEKTFFPDIQRCKIFCSIIQHERYFFQCRNCSPSISLQDFCFPRNQVCRTQFFLKSPISPLISQMVVPFYQRLLFKFRIITECLINVAMQN